MSLPRSHRRSEASQAALPASALRASTSRAVPAEQVDVPGQRDAEGRVVVRLRPVAAEEGDLQVHRAAPGEFLVQRRLVLDRVRRQHARGEAGTPTERRGYLVSRA